MRKMRVHNKMEADVLVKEMEQSNPYELHDILWETHLGEEIYMTKYTDKVVKWKHSSDGLRMVYE